MSCKMSVRYVPSSDKDFQVAYQTAGAAGFDIRADKDAYLMPGDIVAISTGLFVESEGDPMESEFVPELQIRSRSGLALKNQIIVLNSPGTIDIDYQNEIKVILMNIGKIDFAIKRGDRIAQGVFATVHRPASIEVNGVVREGGFGSTGK